MTTESDETGIGIPVTGEVRHELERSAELNASAIHVVSHDGIVRLTGTVACALQQLAATKLALRIPGVVTVDDQIATGAPPAVDLTNSEIASAVDKSLLFTAGIPRGSLQASVRGHAVTLSGAVEWTYQKELAGYVVSRIHGVRSVDNDIDVAARLAPRALLSNRADQVVNDPRTRRAPDSSIN